MASVPQFERIPPASLDAEQAVLGAILLDESIISRVLEILNPDDFYRENHKQIFRAAQSLWERGEPTDNIMVSNELEKMGVLDRIGGRAHLALMEHSVPTAANAEYYARIVKDRSYKRQVIHAGTDIVRMGYDEALEGEETINRAQATVYAIAEDLKLGEFAKMYSLLRETMVHIEARQQSGAGIVGVPSGFYDLDALTNGFKQSDLIVVAGRPSMGKTSFALNVGRHAAVQQGIPVAIFSLEMSQEQLAERLLCEQAGIDAQRMHRGMLSEHETDKLVRALGELGDAPIFIDDSAILDEFTLMLKARRIKHQENIGLMIIDYIQLMRGRRRVDDNRVQEVSDISRAIKAIARELKVPVLALSQLSRAPEQRTDKRPILSDLRESGSIEQDSDMVILLFRSDYYNKEDRPGMADVILAKNRNGPTDTVTLKFRRELTRFENLDRRRELPPGSPPALPGPV